MRLMFASAGLFRLIAEAAAEITKAEPEGPAARVAYHRRMEAMHRAASTSEGDAHHEAAAAHFRAGNLADTGGPSYAKLAAHAQRKGRAADPDAYDPAPAETPTAPAAKQGGNPQKSRRPKAKPAAEPQAAPKPAAEPQAAAPKPAKERETGSGGQTHGFGEVKGGERWITVHPNGPDEPGHPLLIKVDPHNPNVGRVIGGAGGKLNYMQVHLKSPEQYKKEASDKRAERARKAAARDPGTSSKKSAALKEVNEARVAEEAKRLGEIGEKLGWGKADDLVKPPEEDVVGLDPKAAAKVQREHLRKLARDVAAAAEAAKRLLNTDQEARAESGLAVLPLRAEATNLGAADLMPDKDTSRAKGYKPETSGVDDATIRAEKVRALEGRMADAALHGNPEDAARTAQRLARFRPIEDHEIDGADPSILAGWARTVSQRYDRLTNYIHAAQKVAEARGDAAPADPIGEDDRAELDHLSKLVDGPLADAINNAHSGYGRKRFGEWLKLARKHGLLDPAAAGAVDKKRTALKFDEAGAPEPEKVTADHLATLDERALNVLVDEAASRVRADVTAPPDVRRAASKAQDAVAKERSDGPPDAGQRGIPVDAPARDVQEEAIIAPSLTAEEKRAFLQRAIEVGAIGSGAKQAPTVEEAQEKRDAREVAIQHGAQAAEVMALHRQLKEARAGFAKTSRKINRGFEAEGTDYDPANDIQQARVSKGGAVDLSIDPKATAALVQDLEDDMRTRAARSFLTEIQQAYGAAGDDVTHLQHEDARADLERHLSFGAADALNNHAQTILGGPTLDRQAIDVLGADGAAQVLAWAIHQHRAGDVQGIHNAVGDYHAATQKQQAEEAEANARESFMSAQEISRGMEAGGDLTELHEMNRQRIAHLQIGRETLGRTLGAMEATAALHRALGSPPASSVRVSLGPTSVETVTAQMHAIGLDPADYKIHDDGTNRWAEVGATGLPKLVQSVDPEAVRQHADMEAIKRGDHDQAGYLPPNLTDRSTAPDYRGPPAPLHAEPMDYDLKRHASLKEAVATYIGQRANDGWSPGQINRDLLSATHRKALTSGGGGGEHPALAEWDRANPAPPEMTQGLFGDEPNPAHAQWKADRAEHAATLGPAPSGGAGDKRLVEYKQAIDDLLPSRTREPQREAKAKADEAELLAAKGQPNEREIVQKIAERYGHQSLAAAADASVDHIKAQNLLDYLREIQAGQHGPKRMAESWAPLMRAMGEEVAQRRGSMAGAIHHQQLHPQHAHDAAFRALARHPEATAAFKPVDQLTGVEREALRAAFHRYHASANVKGDTPEAQMERWHARNPEPQVHQVDLTQSFEELQAKHAAWQKDRDAKKARVDALAAQGKVEKEVIDWPGYKRAHRSAEKAYAAVQDLVKGRFLDDFRAQYQGLAGEPLKAGITPISGWQAHRQGTDPEFKAWWEAHQQALRSGNLQNRTATGRYTQDQVAAKIDARKADEGATAQRQTGGFDDDDEMGEGRARTADQGAPEKHERITLGENVEHDLGEIVAQHAQMIDPRRPFAARTGLRMDGDKIHQQRAIRAWVRTGRIGMFLGAGSGKTLVAFGAHGELRQRGKANRGLYAVPSIVQEQFGGEGLGYIKPGSMRWWAHGGASREERMKAYADPSTHMVVMTHASLRDDVTHMVAQHLGIEAEEAAAKISGYNADNTAHAGAWSEEETDKHVRDALQKHGAEGLLDFLAVDEGHVALNRQGKRDSHMARVIDALGRNAKHVGYMTGSPVKNDPSELHDQLRKIAPHEYGEGPGKISRAAFMRRYGASTTACAAALRREMSRHVYTGKVDPGTDAHFHHETIPLNEATQKRIDEIHKAHLHASRALQRGDVDIGATRKLAPKAFEGAPTEQHYAIAKKVGQTLAMTRDAAINHALNIDPNSPKFDRVAEIVASYKGQTGPDGKPRAGVVFARNLDAVHNIRARLEQDGHRVVTLTGADGADKKESAKRAFQGGDADVIVLSDAGATGANLQQGSYLIEHDIPQTFMTWDQRQARINRIDPSQKGGPPRRVDVHTLGADHHWEAANRERLERKKALDDINFDGASERLDDSGLGYYMRQHLAPEMQPVKEPSA